MSIMTSYDSGGYTGLVERVWLNGSSSIIEPSTGESSSARESTYNFLLFVTAQCDPSLIEDVISVCGDGRRMQHSVRVDAIVTDNAKLRNPTELLRGRVQNDDEIECPPDFFDFESGRLYEDVYLPLTSSLDGRPVCIGQHVFIVLDEQSKVDHTCVVASDSDGDLATLRVEIDVLLYYLLPIECLRMGITEMAGLDAKVLQHWRGEQTGSQEAATVGSDVEAQALESTRPSRGLIFGFYPDGRVGVSPP
jgi:hypothetical protein